PLPDAIAECVLSAFHALPAKCKPRTLASGRREWVPLAGIVLSKNLTCAALATGMKCLSHAKLPLVKGNVLHDSHAEVLAIRGFNRWLVDECAELARRGEQESDGQESRTNYDDDDNDTTEPQPFALRADVEIHMYASQAPCGDASMELIMSAQEDATPWSHPPDPDSMQGRGNFDRLGVVRRKPARPDAPVTWSKSCSDKLAMRQCTSLLSGSISLLVHPGRAYAATLVLPEGQYVETAVERAFAPTGRMKGAPLLAKEGWRGGYGFRGFEVLTTREEFEYSRERAALGDGGVEEEEAAAVGSNLSAIATLSGREEILINGVLQGRKQSDPRGASCVSRRRLWEDVCGVLDVVGSDSRGGDTVRGMRYSELKVSLRAREAVKRDVRRVALQGWRRNDGDDDWSLD
ncbi:hypothetical protein BAUCODRAFT_51391, partial [Baudoinia panamericana UAMH 10762]